MRLKSETGKTLREAIRDERLSRAETLLLCGHTVKDVAKQLRFTSANHLTRVFASRHGRTISAWLKDNQLSENP
jgi:AraC-like DNA-binding protein